ncbi:MAG: carboxypeptidase regulatory-like domain-containing protein [Clostridia bacterium]|nr:carboxypeptidase regulatory-like domain-containing protein [Clostridia bacterium]
MKKTVWHKLLLVLCVVLSIALLACSCGDEPTDPTPNTPETPDASNKLTYTVTVTDENGAAVADATVEIFSGSNSKGTAKTNANGVATLEVDEGLYTSVKASKEGYLTKETMIPTDSKAVSVQLPVDPNVTYKVTVVKWPDEPIAGAVVQLCVGDICRLPVTTDENGVATLKLNKDNYTVKVFADGYEIEPYYTFEEGSTELTISLLPTRGSIENPIFFDEAEGNELTVGAGETVYFMFRAGGATMNLVGSDVTVLHNDETYTADSGMVTITECYSDGYSPSLFAVTNNGSAEATYTVNFLYPVGYPQNPAALVIGSNTVTVADSYYYYTYTATTSGILTVTIDSACTDWTYVVTNMTSSVGGAINSSTDGGESSSTVTVTTGDIVQVQVAATSSEEATVIFTVAFDAAA